MDLQQLQMVPKKWAYQRLPLHWFDEAAGWVVSIKSLPYGIFAEGWGTSLQNLEKLYSLKKVPKISPIRISWLEESFHEHIPFIEGTFQVPQAKNLPPPMVEAHFRFIPPPGNSKKLCLLFAGWGDHGYNLRMRMVSILHQLRIGALLLESPFHGRRAFPDRTGSPAFTVEESGQLGHAAIAEGRALLHFFKKEGYRVGLSGFSMGGGFAGTLAAISQNALPTTLLAAPYSPEVSFLKGVLRRGIHWESLGGVDNPQEVLRKLFRRVSILNLPPPKSSPKTIFLGGKSDRVIPAPYIQKFHRHWVGSEIRWRPGGHVSLWLFEIPAMAAAIADSFKK